MNTEKEILLNETYNKYIQTSLENLPLEEIDEFIDEEIMAYGTAIDEKLFSISDYRELINRQREQTKNFDDVNYDITPVTRKILSDENSAIFIDEITLTMLVNNETNKLFLRLTTVLDYREEKWVVIHFHGSLADHMAGENDPWHVEEWKQKKAELEKLVDEKTADLVYKNRELEIEAALERVRARAMSMRQSDELQELVSVVFQELTALDIQLTRCIIWIFNPDDFSSRIWMANPEDELKPSSFYIPFHKHKTYEALIKAWKENLSIWEYDLKGETKTSWDQMLFTETELKNLPDVVQQAMKEPDRVVITATFNNFGTLQTAGLESLSEEQCNILQRFGNVFDLSYTRFNDLKQAEEQAREAQIELGLERVRARAMAMQKSEELSELVDTVFKELTKLDFELSWCMINIIDESSLSNMVWATNPNINEVPDSYHMKFEDYPFHDAMMKGYKERATKFIYVMEGTEKKVYDEYLFNETEFRKVPEEAQVASRAMEKYICSFTFSNFGGLQIVGEELPSDENLDILSRFGKVFDLTYTRFNDLKQAEEQAREAQIEVALERVRSRSMAMHSSDELVEASDVMFDEMKKLKIDTIRIGIGIIDSIKNSVEVWSRSEIKGRVENKILGVVPPGVHPIFDNLVKAWKENKPYFSSERVGDEVREYYEKLSTSLSYPQPFKFNKRETMTAFFFAEGSLNVISLEPLKEEECNIMVRFARVFGQMYRRFLDLKQAEEQAREAKIEAALERVRSRTMAMQRSEELSEAASLLFNQIANLGTKAWSSGFQIWNPDEISTTAWMSAPDGGFLTPLRLPHTEDPYFKSIYDARHRPEGFFVMESGSNELKETYRYMFSIPEWKKTFGDIEESGFPIPTFQMTHCVFFPHGYLMFITYEPCPEMWDVFKRFGKVFEQTYTRFLDLKQAEAQAREAQIEAALERVRSRTMGMQKSDELQEAAMLLFQQVESLGVSVFGCGFNIWGNDRKTATAWMAGKDRLQPPFKTSNSEDIFLRIYEAAQRGESLFVEEQGGEELEAHYKYMASIHVFKEVMDKMAKAGHSVPSFQIMHCAYFSQGYLMFITFEPASYAYDIFKRFAKAFEQTYTRFLDLKKAEAQAREAQIEVALERVRSKAMAMHKSEELRDVIACIFQQLQDLGFVVPACSLVIYQEDLSAKHWFAGFSHDSYPESYTIPYVDIPYYTDFLVAWQKGSTYEEFIMEGQPKVDYAKWLLEHSEFKNLPKEFVEQSGMLTPIPMYFADAYMRYGMVEIIGNESLSQEKVTILKRISEVFEQTYTRFLDLQKAEEQAREAQIETALEKIRNRTLLMKDSSELNDAVSIFFQQFKALDLLPAEARTYFSQVNTVNDTVEVWMTHADGKVMSGSHFTPMTQSPLLKKYYDEWKKNKEFINTRIYKGQGLIDYMNFLSTLPHVARDEDYQKLFKSPPNQIVMTDAGFLQGFLGIMSYEPLKQEAMEMLKRFTKVFEFTYTRFLDLQKAEAQAREAQIETALERVRSRTMAMHKSDDLTTAVATVFEELRKLGLKTIRCGVGIFDGKNKKVNVWTSSSSEKSDSVQVSGDEMLEGHSLLDGIYDSWQRQQDYSYVLKGEDLTKYYNVIADSNLPLKAPELNTANVIQYYHCVMFPAGGLFAFRESEFTAEAKQLMRRFADVFHLTFIRHHDLKNAEAQNKIIQAENERKTQELEEARQLQLAMLPKELPELPNLDIAVYMQTATEVGGDYYDFQVGIDGTLTTIIGDATGHGMKAGTVVTITKSLFNSMAASENILSTFDKISQVIKGMKFRQLAMCLIMMKIKGDRLSISSAAMPPVLIYRQKNKSVEEIFLKGMPLGTMMKFPYKKIESHLNSGDRILLYSDGLPELANDKSEMYGYDRIKTEFHSVGEKEPEEIVNHLKNSASQWVNDKAPDDDVTFVVIKVK